MRILIAEDDPASQLFFSKVLSDYGECVVAQNGLDAINFFLQALKDENKFDLVCLDIMLPKVDGAKTLQTLRRIEEKANLSRTKVLLMTALDDSKLVRDCVELGVNGCITKPISIEELKMAVESNI